MAGARRLLGRPWVGEIAPTYLAGRRREAEAVAAYSKALGEYYNVFVYADSSLGPAALLNKAIKDILETTWAARRSRSTCPPWRPASWRGRNS